MLIANKIFVTNGVDIVKGDDELIEKFVELKTEKLSKGLKLS